MAPKSKQIVHQIGLIEFAPSATKSVSTYKVGKNSYEMQNTSKVMKKDTYGGCTSTTKFTQTKKGGEFVDRRSGNNGYKNEVKCQTTHRINNKAQGYTKEYQTEVKVKETTTYHNNNNNNSKNYSYKKIGGYNNKNYEIGYGDSDDVYYC